MGKTFIIAEIGINHNGDINIAKKLIDSAVFAGCDAVKFQKRTVNKVYTKADLDRERKSPWGITNRQQKEGLEFGKEEYDIIDAYCKEKGIEWMASAWDLESVNFLKQYDLKHNKIASAMLTLIPLLHAVAEQRKYTFISTGMSTMEEIKRAVDLFRMHGCGLELMHCNSQYPMPDKMANLKCMATLKKTFGGGVGYSGHEVGLITSVAAVALGATSIERHITLDRSMYGSDQSSSIEPMGLYRLVEYIRVVESALGDGQKVVSDVEKQVKSKLSRVRDY